MTDYVNNKKAYIAFISVCFFWGTTYFAIKIGVQHLHPFLFSGVRHVIAGFCILFYFIVVKKQAIPSIGLLKKYGIAGILLVLMANVSICYAEMYIDSGLAALLCALLPFYLLIIDQLFGHAEKLTLSKYIGLGLGLIGMVMLSWGAIGANNSYFGFGVGITLLANLSWAFGTIYIKKHLSTSSVTPFYGAGWQMMLAGLLSTGIAVALGELNSVGTLPTEAWISLFYLVIFGSIVGFGSYAYAVSHLPVSLVSIHVYINPLVALILGIIFLGEPFNWPIVPAAILTLCGVYIVNKRKD